MQIGGLPTDMKHVDVRGEVCPRPALIVRRELDELGPGEELVVEGDYAPAEQNLRRSCEKHGYEVTALDASDDVFELQISRPRDGAADG